jgi:hypothetical protein
MLCRAVLFSSCVQMGHATWCRPKTGGNGGVRALLRYMQTTIACHSPDVWSCLLCM